MASDHDDLGRAKARRIRAVAAGVGISLATCAGVLINLLTSSFSWLCTVILIAVVLSAMVLAAWERLVETTEVDIRARGQGETRVTQLLDTVTESGQVIGVDTTGDQSSRVVAGQQAREVAGQLTGVRISKPGADGE